MGYWSRLDEWIEAAAKRQAAEDERKITALSEEGIAMVEARTGVQIERLTGTACERAREYRARAMRYRDGGDDLHGRAYWAAYRAVCVACKMSGGCGGIQGIIIAL